MSTGLNDLDAGWVSLIIVFGPFGGFLLWLVWTGSRNALESDNEIKPEEKLSIAVREHIYQLSIICYKPTFNLRGKSVLLASQLRDALNEYESNHFNPADSTDKSSKTKT